MLLTLNDYTLAAGFTVLAALLGWRLRRNHILPSRRPIWWLGMAIAASWVVFHSTVGFANIDRPLEVAWAQSIQYFTLAHGFVVLWRHRQ